MEVCINWEVTSQNAMVKVEVLRYDYLLFDPQVEKATVDTMATPKTRQKRYDSLGIVHVHALAYLTLCNCAFKPAKPSMNTGSLLE